MSFKKILPLLFLIITNFVFAQVKIGENPNKIDAASIIELESTTKAFVLTRVSTTQMENIKPLRGALVFNTETNCVHYFNGIQWQNLCNTSDASKSSVGIKSTVDNGNGTITFNYTDGTYFTTSNLTGQRGLKGADGAKGDKGAQG
ncbi:hypothetical protein HCG49_17825, partial [Arenibacter sp. 6A1]|uniref:hypothetical protein n=1 Tax=Arenibacter sp. 6A1 TaxID=2720391 RepID=UPI0014454820